MEGQAANRLTSGRLVNGLARLALPMFASALLQNTQSLIDLFWVGRLGSDAVAALAMSGTILMMLYPVVMGTATGTVALVSRAVGAGRLEAASETAGQSLMLALVVGVAAGAVGWVFALPLCRLLGAGPTVAALATSYLKISFIGSFTAFMLFISSSILQGAGNTLIPMCAMVLSNLLNIILDPIMIFGLLGLPPMGVRGAALATVCAQALATLLLVIPLGRGAAGIRIHFRQWRLRPSVAWEILRIGIPSSGQMLSRSLMSLVLMRIVAGCGTAAIAAYGIGLRFHMIILWPAFSLGNAAATMVGQNLGAGKPRRATGAAWLAVAIDTGIMLVAAALILPLAPSLISVFDPNAEVVNAGAAYLRTVSPFYLFTGLAIVLGRALNGAGKTVATMVFTVISLWGLQVPLAIVLSRVLEPATQGIWWAIAMAPLMHGVLVTGWFLTRKWEAGIPEPAAR